ncbi:MAG: nicotinate-nucleotide adenylyltransferase [Legionellales bacterium]|nr:nicotinate-nucleotide adenylyltransferase [Legionellales bacterium]
MTLDEPIGILGGAFDPIHNGHLHLALELSKRLHLGDMRLLPSQYPLLKQTTGASIAQRYRMLQLALIPYPQLRLDTRELFAHRPLYSIDTLSLFRQEFPHRPLWFVIGMDNLHQLPQWHQWHQLVEMTHLIVVNRPNYSLPTTTDIQQCLSVRLTEQVDHLRTHLQGLIHCITLPPQFISSTAVRQQLLQGSLAADQLPPSVVKYIQQQKLYCHRA